MQTVLAGVPVHRLTLGVEQEVYINAYTKGSLGSLQSRQDHGKGVNDCRVETKSGCYLS